LLPLNYHLKFLAEEGNNTNTMRAKITPFCLLLCIALLSSGCASILLAGASGGAAYTLTNVAYKTISFPIEQVENAAHRALKKMGIKESGKKKIENGVEISATTAELKIYIELERITAKSTKISVDAKKGTFIKDRATATEIIEQTERILEGRK